MNKQHDELAASRKLRELRSTWQQALDADVLDANIERRLEAARIKALHVQTVTLKPSVFKSSLIVRKSVLMWLPAAAAMLVVALWLPQKMWLWQTVESSQNMLVEKIDSGNSTTTIDFDDAEPWQEDPDLLAELEFYTWLEAEATNAS